MDVILGASDKEQMYDRILCGASLYFICFSLFVSCFLIFAFVRIHEFSRMCECDIKSSVRRFLMDLVRE